MLGEQVPVSKLRVDVESEEILQGLAYDSGSVTSTEIAGVALAAVEVVASPVPILL